MLGSVAYWMELIINFFIDPAYSALGTINISHLIQLAVVVTIVGMVLTGMGLEPTDWDD